MRSAPVSLLATAGLVFLAACAASTRAPSPTPLLQAGWARYTENRVEGTITCPPDTPLLLEGNRTELRVVGKCRQVRIAGRGNEIEVEILPGGTIEITGRDNDVTWRQTAPGPGPQVRVTGSGNDVRRGDTGPG